MTQEIWKHINGYDNYEISNLGNVRNTRNGRIIKPQIDTKGYHQVGLSHNGKRILFLSHRLVAQAFIPNPNNLPQVNHKNEIKTDNRVENLEWCDAKYNNTYGTRSKPILQISMGGEFIREWESSLEASQSLGINQGNIVSCLTRTPIYKKGVPYYYKSAGGYKWYYKNGNEHLLGMTDNPKED